MITKHKYSIFRHIGGNMWLMIKDIHACFDESSDWDCQIGRYISILENKPSMGCVWNADIFVMAMDSPRMIEEFHHYTFDQRVKSILGFNCVLYNLYATEHDKAYTIKSIEKLMEVQK